MYAGGDRPFFEDVEAVEPTIYMIHNLLTSIECDTLIQRADPLVTPVTKADALQLTVDPSPFVNVDRVMLWEGALQGPGGKAIDERIEQITGFPSQHYSDWTVDRLKSGSHWNPHYDLLPSNFAPLATITVFLSGVSDGGEMVFPSTQTSPVKIRPVKGLAVVHHNSNEKQEFDVNSIHGLLPVAPDDKDAVLYIGRKYILPDPVSKARRTGLPVVSWASGGKLPAVFVKLHDGLTGHFGFENGSTYFDKIIVFTPIFLFLIVAQYVGQLVHKHLKETGVVSPPLETKNSIASKNDSVSKIQPGESKVAKKSSKKRN